MRQTKGTIWFNELVPLPPFRGGDPSTISRLCVYRKMQIPRLATSSVKSRAGRSPETSRTFCDKAESKRRGTLARSFDHSPGREKSRGRVMNGGSEENSFRQNSRSSARTSSRCAAERIAAAVLLSKSVPFQCPIALCDRRGCELLTTGVLRRPIPLLRRSVPACACSEWSVSEPAAEMQFPTAASHLPI